MRDYVKNVYPTYRFSITATVRCIRISLMEYPVELTNRDMLLHYYAVITGQPVLWRCPNGRERESARDS